MNDIRVTFSGLVSLVLGIINIPLGFGFMLIVTRTLEPTEYGTWGLISGIIVYATILEQIISYWGIREIARNQDSGKTAIFSGLLFSMAGIGIYLISAYVVGTKTDADQNVILMASILIPLIFVNRILTSITLGWKPQGASYGQIIFGLSQIPCGFALIYFLKLGTVGVIYAVGIAYGLSIIFLLIYNKEKIYGSIKKEYLKKWINYSWLSIYPAIGGMIFFLDVAIYSIITESVIGLAYWTASLVITTIIASSGLISRAVYSKLLQCNNSEFISDSLRHLFYFSILFTVLIIAFAKPGLYALNPEYAIAEFIVIVLALQSFMFTITGSVGSFILGIEKVDTNKKSTFKDYFKSKLFFMPTLTLIQATVYIVLLTLMLLSLVSISDSQIDLIFYWALISLIVQIPITIYTGIIFRKNFTIRLEFKSILKYLFSAFIVFIISQILISSFLDYQNDIFKFLPQVILFIIIGTLIYLGITIVIDSKTKFLAKSILLELKK